MEWYFRVKASTDLEAKRVARNMAIEALRKKNMIGRWFEVQNVEWLQKGLFGDGVLAKVHVYVKDNKIMKNAKVRSFLAQEFRDLKARLSKKSFKDAVDTLRVRIKAYQYGKDGEYAWYAEETNGKRATDLSTKYFKTAEEAISAGKKEVQGYSTNSTKWIVVDSKPKSQREVWLTGLSSIKDSLTRFKDEMVVERFANNGCAVELIKTDSGKYKYRVSKGSKFKESGTAYNTILEAADEAKHTAESFNDSAINDFVVRRINEGNIEILVNNNGYTLGYILRKKGSVDKLAERYGFSNTYEAEQAGIKAAKNFNDSAIKDGRISHREKIGAYEIKIWEYEKDYPVYGGKYSYHISRYDGATDLASGICNSEQEAISEAKRKVKQFMNHDSAINDEIVRRVDYKGCHIYIGKQGDYTYSVYTKNSMGRPLAWDTGYGSESEALEAAKKSADLIVQKFGDSAEYINDRKIDIKKDGKLIDTVNAETLDEAVRIYERQHPELKGQIDAYFSDEKVKDGFEEEWSKLMFKMKRLQMNPNTKWSEMEALNEEMNALKKKYGKNN